MSFNLVGFFYAQKVAPKNAPKVRKACKEYIVGMESEAEYIERLEGILSQYTEEDLEVRGWKYRIKSEQMVYLSCYHLLSDETIHYRLHTTPEGEVAKVEKENKIQGGMGRT